MHTTNSFTNRGSPARANANKNSSRNTNTKYLRIGNSSRNTNTKYFFIENSDYGKFDLLAIGITFFLARRNKKNICWRNRTR